MTALVPADRRLTPLTTAAVYNRFWHSQGGGERHAGMVAEVLSRSVPGRPAPRVDLVGHTDVDLDELGDHLGLDLSRCTYRKVPDRGDEQLAALSAEYGLWVTASYMSRLAPRAQRNAYLCYFPTPADHDMIAWRKLALRTLGPYLRLPNGGIDFGLGWYPPEGGRRRKWVWTSGDGALALPAGTHRLLRADFGRPGALGSTTLSIEDEHGNVRTMFEVTPDFRAHRLDFGASVKGIELHLRSDTFEPGGTDVRELGVAMSRARFLGAGGGPRRWVALRFPWLRLDPNDLSFLSAYDTVMANSEYTRSWIRRLWRLDADVLFPPIPVEKLTPAGVREKVVLSVGRFFAPGLGHAKRQLEMVGWFGALYRAGRLPGWRMHVVGGCEDSQLPYLAQVRAAAAGLPVEISPNAPRKEVENLLSTASVFWSATGYGERAKPWAAEHFGMTTVEAMAGGCVPVVIDLAGQKEIVREGVDGFRWSEPAELMDRTAALAADDGLRARLAVSSSARAQQFSEDAFAGRWNGIADRRDLLLPR